MLKRLSLGALAALALVSSAFAQSGGSTTRPTWFDGAAQYYISTAHPLPISGSISASLSGFPTIQTTGTPISVTTGGVTGSLPSGAVVVASNVGTTNAAYCKLGASATTSDQYIAPSGGWFAFTVGANTQLTCITSTSTTTVNMVGGSGLPTGTGGGGGGSGGGGAVTLASGAVASGAYAAGALAVGAGVDGWDIQVGPTTATAATVGSVGSVNAKLRYITTQLDNINTNVAASIPAGTALIGDVNVRQGGTALSTTNGIYSNQLQGNAVLSATNPSFSRPTDGTSARVFDPCEVVAHVTTPISISSAATSIIVAGTSSKKTYICSMMLMSAGTTNVGIVQGSGSTCGTSTLGLIGGATAATGPNLTAQAGFVAGSGNFAIAGTTVNANDICLINSLAIQVSGYIVTATP